MELNRHYQEKILISLSVFRKKLLFYAFLFPLIFILILPFSREIMIFIQSVYGERLVFFGILEPLTSLLKLSFLLAIIICLAPFLYSIIDPISHTFNFKKKSLSLATISVFLYILGLLFCFFVTLPFGIKFLIGFQGDNLQPAISVNKFIDFTLFISLIFGIIFQLPILILLLTYSKLISIEKLKESRKISFFIIVVISAIITPTPDILNLLLLSIPFYFLYEAGIVMSKIYK